MTANLDRRGFLSAMGAAGVAGVLPAIGCAHQEAGTGTASRGPSPYWPDGARLVISVSMQLEAGAQPERGASSPFPPIDTKSPDLPAATWYEYGINEGIPRLLDLFGRKGVQVTSHMVGRAVERHPGLAREIVQRGHEAAAHGQTWTPQFSMTPEEERSSYEESVAVLERITGARPVGFNAFWLRGTPRTLEFLQDLGFLYSIDDVSRDEPFVTQVRGRPFAIVPYTLRNNDIVRYDSPALTARAFGDELKDEFDVLHAEAATRRRMMSISVHDRIGGTPARVKVLGEFIDYARSHPGVVFMRKDAIARFALSGFGVAAGP
ncbi:polysaccharide deacetylase family protein [Myxococcaceae bacterium GXIMD 01537]